MDQRAIFSKEMYNETIDVPLNNFDLVIIGKIIKVHTNNSKLFTKKKKKYSPFTFGKTLRVFAHARGLLRFHQNRGKYMNTCVPSFPSTSSEQLEPVFGSPISARHPFS